MVTPRSFPAPWSAALQPNYYVVRDADGQQIAYVYNSNDPEPTISGEVADEGRGEKDCRKHC
jgi:hypothetical protein